LLNRKPELFYLVDDIFCYRYNEINWWIWVLSLSICVKISVVKEGTIAEENIELSEEETEGQLAIDVYQDDENIYILAPIAGTAPADIDVSITDEVVTIRGERKSGHKASDEQHFVQECYWGSFSRTFVTPVEVSSEKAKAILKNGLLSITIPKSSSSKSKSLKIELG